MWIEEKKTKDGSTRYTFYERYKDPFSGKTKRVSVSLNSCSTHAKNQAAKMLAEKIANAAPDPDKVSLAKVREEYLAYKSKTMKASTLKSTTYYTGRLLNALPDGVLIDKIDVSMVENVFVHLELKNSTKKQLHLYFKQLIKFAHRRGYLEDISFLNKISLNFTDREPVKENYIATADVPSVLAQIKSERKRRMCEFQILTGLRFGELAALRWRDIDGDVLDVNGTYDFDHKTRTTPKTRESNRKVQLNQRAKAILGWFQANNAYIEWAHRGVNRDGYIFISNRGRPQDKNYLNQCLKRIAYKIPITTHTFRHTHITMLLELGVPIKTIMRRVGHATPNMIYRIYGHVTEKMERELAQKMEHVSFGS